MLDVAHSICRHPACDRRALPGQLQQSCPGNTAWEPMPFAGVLSLGSRDGAILLWDLRTPSSWSAAKRRMQLSPVMRVDTTTADGQQFSQPAAAADAGGGGAARRARKSKRDCMSRRSVTSLLFVRQEHTMISSSDCDGVIKLWDLRKLTVPTGDLTLPSGPAGGVCSAAAARTPGAARTRADGRSVDGPAGSHLGVEGNGADTEGLSWLGFSGASRNSRAAGITCMALSPTGKQCTRTQNEAHAGFGVCVCVLHMKRWASVSTCCFPLEQ